MKNNYLISVRPNGKVKLIMVLMFVINLFYFADCKTQTNLINNGDFSAGNTGFLSSYSYCNTFNCMTGPGQYSVGYRCQLLSLLWFHGT